VAKAEATIRTVLSSARCANRNTRRTYGDVLDKLAGERRLADVGQDELAAAVQTLWAQAVPSTWNQRRAAVGSWLAWCAKNGYPSPTMPASLERRPEHADETRALQRAAIQRQLTRKDVPLREKTLWRLLYETAARASEVLALNIDDPRPDARRSSWTERKRSLGSQADDRLTRGHDPSARQNLVRRLVDRPHFQVTRPVSGQGS
jgi:integrase